MHPIIAGEIRKIEALLEGYLGLPPDTINLNTFQIDRFKSVAPSIRRTVERVVFVASLPNTSQADIAFAVNASDFIEQEVGKPRVPKIIRPLYALETEINERPAVNLCRHLASIGLSFYSIAYCNSDTLEGSQIAYFYAVTALVIASLATHLTYRLRSTAMLLSIIASTIIGVEILLAFQPPAATFMLYFVLSLILLGSQLQLQGSSSASQVRFGNLDPQLRDANPQHPDPLDSADPFKISVYHTPQEVIRNLEGRTGFGDQDRYH